MARKPKEKSSGGANLGFEQPLWLAADKLRGNMDAAFFCHPEHVEGSLTSMVDSFHRDKSAVTLAV